MRSRYFIALFGLFGSLCLQAQTWRLHLNVNEYYPLHAEEKGYYPILWYSDTEGRGVLFGGFGGGVSRSDSLGRKWMLKSQLNVSRSRYYDEPTLFTDENGQSLGAYSGIATNLNATALGIAKINLNSWLSVGAGLGLQARVLGKTDYGNALVQGQARTLKFNTRAVQPVILLLPLELTATRGRFSFSARFEYSLTKVSRVPYQSEQRFLTNYFEVGYRLSR